MPYPPMPCRCRPCPIPSCWPKTWAIVLPSPLHRMGWNRSPLTAQSHHASAASAALDELVQDVGGLLGLLVAAGGGEVGQGRLRRDASPPPPRWPRTSLTNFCAVSRSVSSSGTLGQLLAVLLDVVQQLAQGLADLPLLLLQVAHAGLQRGVVLAVAGPSATPAARPGPLPEDQHARTAAGRPAAEGPPRESSSGSVARWANDRRPAASRLAISSSLPAELLVDHVPLALEFLQCVGHLIGHLGQRAAIAARGTCPDRRPSGGRPTCGSSRLRGASTAGAVPTPGGCLQTPCRRAAGFSASSAGPRPFPPAPPSAAAPRSISRAWPGRLPWRGPFSRSPPG